MDEELKNVEEPAAEEVKNETGDIFDQMKEMFGDAANEGANLFDRLKRVRGQGGRTRLL